MKKIIAEKFCVVCPVCKKTGLVAREFDNNTAEIIHKEGKIRTRCIIDNRTSSEKSNEKNSEVLGNFFSGIKK